MTGKSKGVVWFRRNLRLQDNPCIQKAITECEEVVFVVNLEPLWWESAQYGVERMSSKRKSFELQAIMALDVQLQNYGHRLVCFQQKTNSVFSQLNEELGDLKVYTQKEWGIEEIRIEKELQALGIELYFCDTHTLIAPSDLGFSSEEIPFTFTPFRKKIEQSARVQTPCAVDLSALKSTAGIDLQAQTADASDVYARLPEDANKVVEQSAFPFEGDEQSAHKRLQHFTSENGPIRHYKKTRNAMIGVDYSSKLSPFLATGALSARQVFSAVEKHEEEYGANESTYWVKFELFWRDFFKYRLRLDGKHFFLLGGPLKKKAKFTPDKEVFKEWCDARTGSPFVNACLKELVATGFMSNRGRQNAASYLAQDLMVPWTWGAAFFESHLLDYDPASNWGNWAYNCAAGHDPRGRKFNVAKQAQNYDPDGSFQSLWLGDGARSKQLELL